MNNSIMTINGGAVFSITHVDKQNVTLHFREHARGGSIWTVISKEDARAMAKMLSQAAGEDAT